MNKTSKIFRVGISVFIVLFLIKLIFALLPFPELKQFKKLPYSCQVYDTNGYLIQNIGLKDGRRREYSELNKIPKKVQNIFIKAEDKRFYFHHGIDYIAAIRALVQNSSNNRNVSGASTITMQLARIISPSEKRDFKAKIKDCINALKLEARFSKYEILEYYLNSVPFGKNTEGVASAAKMYFAKELDELTEEEIYCLSVIPRSPNLYNPLDNPENCAKAASKICKKYSYDDLLETAKNAESFVYENYLPHYINYLREKFPSVFEQHRKIQLFIDLNVQYFSEKQLISSLSEASQKSRISNGAVIVVDVKNSAVIAWVGSQNFYDKESGQIDGVVNKMQPGSSMKPFLYAACLDKGIIKPSSILSDIPKYYGNQNLYIPQNFNNRFNGPVKARVALASSLNIPAVDLLNTLTVEEYINILVNCGFESLNNKDLDLGLSLALGSGEIELKELVNAFTVFPNDGVYKDLKHFKVLDGKKVKVKNKGRRLFSKDTSRIICSFLSDKKARTTGFGYYQTFETDYPSIFKTGTSNQFQNITAIGSTTEYTVGVWMGNYNGNTVIGKTGSSLPAYCGKNILDYLEKGKVFETLNFKTPENYHLEKICSLFGEKPDVFCNETVFEYVKNDDELDYCTYHKEKDKINYPAEYQQWMELYDVKGEIEYESMKMEVVLPKNDSIYYLNENSSLLNQIIPIEVFGGSDDILQIYLDGTKIKEIERPFSTTINVGKGDHILNFVSGDEDQLINFYVK